MLVCAPAQAAPDWVHGIFATHLGGRARAASVARYAMESGGGFILDTSSGKALLKFQDGFEVWALTVSRGPRGDLIYWNDIRQPLLRATRMGGFTVFTPRRPEGDAATATGPGTPLRISNIGLPALYQRLLQAAARSSHAAAHTIVYEARDDHLGDYGVMADAALVASEAVVFIASRPSGRAQLSRLSKVRITLGKDAAGTLKEGVLTVTVAPARDAFGRPSSLRLTQVLEGH